ncbi:MAG TPA: hypothetical protein VFK05_37940 [Polyangiaceae bacterium]|nr:hypothetical protein [Polyangiaceae bacterium]
MRIGVILVGALLPMSCGGSSKTTLSNETPLAAAGSAGATHGACSIPRDSFDAGPGSCAVARAYVTCHTPSGAGCLCLSDDPTTCPDCAETFQNAQLSCESKCAANEYAVSCGGPPRPNGNVAYQGVPAGCHSLSGTPGGNQYACCPCD